MRTDPVRVLAQDSLLKDDDVLLQVRVSMPGKQIVRQGVGNLTPTDLPLIAPVQDIVDDRPPRFDRHRIFSQNPVVVERLDRAIFLFEGEPVVDERDHLRVALGNGKSDGNGNRVRLWDYNRV